VGTRPEGIKMAPVVRALRARPERFETLLVSTGQHREMLRQVFDVFALAPDVDLDVMKPGQDLYDVTAASLLGMRDVLRRLRPDWLLVQGDTTTVMAAALAAFYEKIPVGHVEAGLRTGNLLLPYPEEMNRLLADRLTRLHFAPTEGAARALRAEGFDPANIHVTGNTVVDALLAVRGHVRAHPVELPVPEAALAGRRLILVTGHRRESFGETFRGICRAILRVVQAHPDVVVVYPVHLNPNVNGPVRELLGGEARILLPPPAGYLQFVSLLDRAHLVLTDSGGVQEEAPSFAKPVLVMRDVTERPEGVDAGVARLVGTREDDIFAGVHELLSDPAAYARMAKGANPYGDGRASERIADLLAAAGGAHGA
jgi:UDP-N-acetylglucosamine 2-epimerase (non-hydrolysing)